MKSTWNKLKQNRLRLFLILGILLFNLFALARVVPANSQLPVNAEHLYGDYDRSVYRIFELATVNANKPFMQDFDNFLFHGRNPGLFMFTAEMAARLGFDSPLVIQLLSIAMFNIGLLFFYKWTRIAFNSERLSALATVFLALTPFFLFNSSTISAIPYEVLFSTLVSMPISDSYTVNPANKRVYSSDLQYFRTSSSHRTTICTTCRRLLSL